MPLEIQAYVITVTLLLSTYCEPYETNSQALTRRPITIVESTIIHSAFATIIGATR